MADGGEIEQERAAESRSGGRCCQGHLAYTQASELSVVQLVVHLELSVSIADFVGTSSAAFARYYVLLPFASYRTVIVEFYLVLHPWHKVQKLSQHMFPFVRQETYYALLNLYDTILKPHALLQLVYLMLRNPFDRADSSNYYDDDTRSVYVNSSDDLDPGKLRMGKSLRKGFSTHFFYRFLPIKTLKNWRTYYGAHAGPNLLSVESVHLSDLRFDYILVLQSIKWPPLRELPFLQQMLTE